MTELLLEGYRAPSVAYGMADLFSFRHNCPEISRGTGLVVSVGYEATHVLPVVDCRFDSTRAARIDLGGFNFLQAMFKLVRLGKSDAEGLTYHRVRQLVDK
jgi:actin-related protein 5